MAVDVAIEPRPDHKIRTHAEKYCRFFSYYAARVPASAGGFWTVVRMDADVEPTRMYSWRVQKPPAEAGTRTTKY